MNLEEFARTFASETTIMNAQENTVCYGSSHGLNEMEIWERIPTGFEVAWGWCSEPYRMVWLSFEEMATITYCEGDISVTFAATEEAFLAYRISSRNFYGKPRYLDRDFTGEGEIRHLDPEAQEAC